MVATLKRRILGGVALNALEQVSTHLFSLVSFFVIVNELSLKDFGLLHLLFTVISPGTVIALMGMDRLMVADIAVYRAQKEFGRIKELVREYSVAVAVVLVLLFAVSWLFKEGISHYYDANLTPFYWALVFLIIGQVVLNLTSVVFEAYERFDFSLAQKTGEALIRTIAVCSLYLWIGFSLHSVLWAYVIAKCVTASVSIFGVAHLFPHEAEVIREYRGILMNIVRKHGKWEMFSSLSLTITDNIGPWLVNFLVSTESVAIVAFAQKVSSIFGALFPVRGTLFPILSHSIATSKELAIVIATKVKKYSMMIAIVFYFGVVLFIRPVIDIFSPQYGAAVMLIDLAMLRIFIDVLTLGQSAVLYSLKKQKLNFALSLASSVMSAVSQLVCILLFGARGVILSSLLVSFLNGAFREYVLITRLHFSLLDWKALVRFDEHDRVLLAQLRTRLFGWL